jgi:hypothetical protein
VDSLGDMLVSPGFVNGRAVLEGRVVQVADLTESDDFPEGRERARQLGYRTRAWVRFAATNGRSSKSS